MAAPTAGSQRAATRSVMTVPGATALARMLYAPSSSARHCVNPTIANFDVEYGERIGYGRRYGASVATRRLGDSAAETFRLTRHPVSIDTQVTNK